MSKRSKERREQLDQAMGDKPRLRSLEDLKKLQVAKPVAVQPAKAARRPWWKIAFPWRTASK